MSRNIDFVRTINITKSSVKGWTQGELIPSIKYPNKKCTKTYSVVVELDNLPTLQLYKESHPINFKNEKSKKFTKRDFFSL